MHISIPFYFTGKTDCNIWIILQYVLYQINVLIVIYTLSFFIYCNIIREKIKHFKRGYRGWFRTKYDQLIQNYIINNEHKDFLVDWFNAKNTKLLIKITKGHLMTWSLLPRVSGYMTWANWVEKDRKQWWMNGMDSSDRHT